MTLGLISLVASRQFKDLEKKERNDAILKAIITSNNPQIGEIMVPGLTVKNHTIENENEELKSEKGALQALLQIAGNELTSKSEALVEAEKKLDCLKEALEALNDHISSATTDIIDNIDPSNPISFTGLLVLLNATTASQEAKDCVDDILN